MAEEKAIAIVKEPFQETMQIAAVFAESGFFSDTKTAAQAVVKIMAGREYGFGAFSSMTGIHIIQGKPTLSAHLMAAAIKRSGRYNYRVTRLDDKGCTIEFYDNGKLVGPPSTFTEEDAKKAKLLGKEGPWMAYPRNMYFARAMSNGAKFYCPEVFEAGAYVEGEIVDGEVIEPSGAKPTTMPTRAGNGIVQPAPKEGPGGLPGGPDDDVTDLSGPEFGGPAAAVDPELAPPFEDVKPMELHSLYPQAGWTPKQFGDYLAEKGAHRATDLTQDQRGVLKHKLLDLIAQRQG